MDYEQEIRTGKKRNADTTAVSWIRKDPKLLAGSEKNISDLDPGAGSEMNVKLINSDKQMLKLSISQQNAVLKNPSFLLKNPKGLKLEKLTPRSTQTYIRRNFINKVQVCRATLLRRETDSRLKKLSRRIRKRDPDKYEKSDPVPK